MTPKNTRIFSYEPHIVNKINPRCTVLIDEVFQTPMEQRLIGKQLVQSAKFGLKYVFTLHYLNQLYPDVQESLKNANASYMLLAGTDKKAYNAFITKLSPPVQ